MNFNLKNDLILKLYSEIPKLSVDKEILPKVKAYYLEKGIPAVNGIRILNKTVALDGLDDIFLCLFTNSIYKATGNEIFKPTLYFDEETINLEVLYVQDKNSKDTSILIENVDRLGTNHYYSTKISYQDIKYFFGNGIVEYNFKTQRESKKIFIGNDGFLEIPNLKKNNVKKIKEKMKTGKFTANAISFNLLHTLAETPMIYDEKTRSLLIEINEDTRLQILDGWHRSSAIISLIQDIPDFPGFMMANIFNYTETQAREFIKQEASGTGMSDNYLNFIGDEDINITMAKDLVAFGNEKTNCLFGKVSYDFAEVENNIKYTTYHNISTAIKNCFDLSDRIKIRNTQDILLRGLNEIILSKEKQFKKLSTSREKSIVTYNNMFPFYIAIISRLDALNYGEQSTIANKNKLENKLSELMKDFDFSITQKMWKEFNIVDEDNKMKSTINKLDYKNIKKYIEKLIPVEVTDKIENGMELA